MQKYLSLSSSPDGCRTKRPSARGWKTCRQLWGGYIETVTLGTDWTIICNEEGRLIGMPYNCNVCGVDFVGPIVFIGVDGEEFANLPIEFADFKKMFKNLWEDN